MSGHGVLRWYSLHCLSTLYSHGPHQDQGTDHEFSWLLSHFLLLQFNSNESILVGKHSPGLGPPPVVHTYTTLFHPTSFSSSVYKFPPFLNYVFTQTSLQDQNPFGLRNPSIISSITDPQSFVTLTFRFHSGAEEGPCCPWLFKPLSPPKVSRGLPSPTHPTGRSFWPPFTQTQTSVLSPHVA